MDYIFSIFLIFLQSFLVIFAVLMMAYFGIYGEPMTLEAIGDEFELTKERIRQIKEAAIRKIRNNVGDIFNYFE